MSQAEKAIKNRYDFVFLFDVKDGNPNGDPDQVNLPRADTEDQHGLVTDVCIKRKVRNYVQLAKTKEDGKAEKRYDIFIRQRDINSPESYLNAIIGKAEGITAAEKRSRLVDDYYDIRAFGAVLSTGEKESSEVGAGEEADDNKSKEKKVKEKKIKGAGTVRGPVQFTFARSVDRIYQAEHSITRCCVTTEEEKNKQLGHDREFASTFGRKATVPYALYRMHGFVSVIDAKKTGFSEEDLELLWKALINAFENDRAAARGEMNPRKLIAFKHTDHLGNARSGQLFDLIKIKNVATPRDWDDYEKDIVFPPQGPLSGFSGVEVIHLL